MPENPRGWRRLWPSRLWLQTTEVNQIPPDQPPVWIWRIWSEDKQRLLATAAETYSRQATAARGGVSFGLAEMKRLEGM